MSESQLRSNGLDRSPDTEDSGDCQRLKSSNKDRSRRCWSDKEEATLIHALKDLVATGWKSDNGFRGGYLIRVKETLKREFPNTDLKVQPHIHSKITTWKKNYYSLSAILDRSGVGFNADGDFKIDCDDDQWAQIVQKDNNARYMRNKSWPHWEAWKEIFRKDRAGGVRAAGAGESMLKMKAALENANDNATNDYHVTLEDLFPDDVLPNNGVLPNNVIPDTGSETMCAETNPTPQPMKKVNRKHKADDQLDCLIEMINHMHADTNERLAMLSTRIGYEFDLSAKRTEVYELMGFIPGLTLKQNFYACAKLVKEPELLDLFKAMSEIARPAFVMFMLETDGVM